MESIQNRIVENGKRGKATWLYIDEFHVLLNSEYSAKYLQQLWKKVRKQGGLCTGITQNVVDLLQNYTATTMLANSEFVALLKQANTDSSKLSLIHILGSVFLSGDDEIIVIDPMNEYFDIAEFHVLLNSEHSPKYLQQLWKKVRKQGGLCTGITQNVVDLLQNYTATSSISRHLPIVQ